MAFDRFKRMLRAANVYGETARRMENPKGEPAPDKKPKTYTPAEEQDRMKAELEKAREKESHRLNLSTYRPPRRVKMEK